MRAGQVLALLALAGSMHACLPADDRPVPGQIFVTAEPSEATKSGFVTDDGWSVRFDRFVTALGDVDLDGPDGQNDDACNDYSETRYEWLYDFTVAGREKVGVVYALGDCSVEWRLRGPLDDTVLDPGVDENDVRFMSIEDTDAWTPEAEEATLVVRGVATKDGVEKRFDWVFRRSYDIEKCALGESGFASVFDVEGEAEIALPLVVHGEELFRTAASPFGGFTFDPFASADADADGDVTLAELDAVPALDGTVSPVEGEAPPETLADVVYGLSLPRVTRVQGSGSCKYELRGRR